MNIQLPREIVIAIFIILAAIILYIFYCICSCISIISKACKAMIPSSTRTNPQTEIELT